jgi:hypothetical protein
MVVSCLFLNLFQHLNYTEYKASDRRMIISDEMGSMSNGCSLLYNPILASA